jgi:hypothetical protein
LLFPGFDPLRASAAGLLTAELADRWFDALDIAFDRGELRLKLTIWVVTGTR